jgi:hypothetical protein
LVVEHFTMSSIQGESWMLAFDIIVFVSLVAAVWRRS